MFNPVVIHSEHDKDENTGVTDLESNSDDPENSKTAL